MGTILLRYVAPIIVLGSASAIGFVFLQSPPQVQRGDRSTPAPVVGVVKLEPRAEPIFVEAFGTLVPAREVQVQPEITGSVIALHPDLVPGGMIREGERLFKINPSDYEIRQDRADALRAAAKLQVARRQAMVEAFRKDAEKIEADLRFLRWNAGRLSRLNEEGTAGELEARDANSKLLAQQAALAALKARILEQEKSVESARSDHAVAESEYRAAQLDLERTEVLAPFDAVVLTERVELGQRISPQTTVATLVATDEFWVEAAVPTTKLPDIRLRQGGDKTSAADDTTKVKIILENGTAGGRRIMRDGQVLRPLGDLDPQGRMARLLVGIRDPLDLDKREQGSPERLLLGSYVRLEIAAGTLSDVYALPRKALRENDRVWVRDADGKLQIREVEVVWRRKDDVLTRNAFEPGDLVVTTRLSSVIPGMPLEIRSDAAGQAKPQPNQLASKP